VILSVTKLRRLEFIDGYRGNRKEKTKRETDPEVSGQDEHEEITTPSFCAFLRILREIKQLTAYPQT
jgi:hypothetical protein